MKFHTDYMYFNTENRREFINITGDVAAAVRKSKIKEGMVMVSAMHITAGVFINDEEPGIKADIMEMLDGLAPLDKDYRHHRTGEQNGDAHLKNILVHHQVIVPITNGKLDLGPWQQIFYAEFDGQRKKRLVLKAMGE
ncbi:MAG: secondary thiamine-phosphate synthase enzyme YjbQ [Candidatus Zixiibacteriota bacterium]